MAVYDLTSDPSKNPGFRQYDPGGYTDPNPWRYQPTCYYFYDAVDFYEFCDCNESGSPRGYRYIGTAYFLTDSFCF